MVTRVRWAWGAFALAAGSCLGPAEAAAQNKVATATDRVLDVRVSPDGKRVAAGGFGKTIDVWELKGGKREQTLGGTDGPTKTTRTVAFSADSSRVAAGGDDGVVRVWEVRTGKEVLTWRDHEEMITSVAFSSDGKYLAAASGTPENGGATWRANVRLWDLSAGKPGRVLATGKPGRVAFSPDGKLLAVVDGRVRLWDIASGEVVRTLTPDRGFVLVVAFSADGKTLAGGGGDPVARGAGTVEVARAWVWDAGSGKLRRTLDDLNMSLRSIAVSADGTRLATGCVGAPRTDGSRTWVPSELVLWDAATGKELWTVHGAPGDCGGVAFTPDGAAVLYCDGGGVRLVSAATGEITKVLVTTSAR
jgi:WD40 repeat protein